MSHSNLPFQLNLMITGHPNSGKSTLLRSILASTDIKTLCRDDPFFCIFTNTPSCSLSDDKDQMTRSKINERTIQMTDNNLFFSNDSLNSPITKKTDTEDDKENHKIANIIDTVGRRRTLIRNSNISIATPNSGRNKPKETEAITSVPSSEKTSRSTSPLTSTIPENVTENYNLFWTNDNAKRDATLQSSLLPTNLPTKKIHLKLLPLPEWRHLQMPSIGRLSVEFISENWENHIHLRTIDTPSISIPSVYYNLSRSQVRGSINEEYKDHGHMKESMEITRNVVKLITSFTDLQFENTLLTELQIDRTKLNNRRKTSDFLIHCCIYVVDPRVCTIAEGLTLMDIFALQELTSRTNVILCIGKSDTLSNSEINEIKSMIQKSVSDNKIEIFSFPEISDLVYTEEQTELNNILRKLQPFTVINPTDLELGPFGTKDTFRVPLQAEGNNIPDIAKPEHHRTPLFYTLQKEEEEEIEPTAESIKRKQHRKDMQTNWKRNIRPKLAIDCKNPEHSDFINVLCSLFDTHIEELTSCTRNIFYERWRTAKLTEVQESELKANVAR